MFDLIDLFAVGHEIVSGGEPYVTLKHVHGKFYLAARKDAQMPAPVMLVEVDEAEKERSNEKAQTPIRPAV